MLPEKQSKPSNQIHLWRIFNRLVNLSLHLHRFLRKKMRKWGLDFYRFVLCGCRCSTYPLVRCRSLWGGWGRSWRCWLGRWRSASSWRDCSSSAPGCGSQGVVRNTWKLPKSHRAYWQNDHWLPLQGNWALEMESHRPIRMHHLWNKSKGLKA